MVDANALQSNIVALLNKLTVGEARPCKMCDRKIWFISDPKTSVVTPYTDQALNHNIDCPGAERYRQQRERNANRGLQPKLFATNPEAL